MAVAPVAPVAAAKSSKRRTGGTKMPIIIVPTGPKDTITLWNIQQFLETGVFEHSANVKARVEEKARSVVIERKKGGKSLRYTVVDNALSLKEDEWSRVLAIFCSGPEWQFKKWPPYENSSGHQQKVLNLFSKACGMYVHFDDQSIASHSKDWNVVILPLSSNWRHNDSLVVGRIWDALDVFVAEHRPDFYV